MLVEPVAGNMGVVPPVAGLPRGAPRRDPARGRAARLRRGHDRLAGAPGGRAGAVRHRSPISPASARSSAADCPRRPTAARATLHGADRPGRARSTRPARSRATRSRWPPGSRRSTCCRARAPGSAPSAGPRARPPRSSAAAAAAGVPVTVQRVGTMLTPFFTDAPVRDYAGAKRTDKAAYNALLPRHARGGRLPPAVRVRGRRSRPPCTATRSSPRSRPRWPPHGRGSDRRRRHRRTDRGVPPEAARRAGRGVRGGRAGGRHHPDRAIATAISPSSGPTRSRRRRRRCAALIAELGLEPSLVAASPAARKRYVVRKNRLLAAPDVAPGVPHHPAALQRRQAGRLRRAAGRAPATRRSRRASPTFVRRRFNQEIVDYVANPFVGGHLRRRPGAALGPPRAAEAVRARAHATARSSRRSAA